MQVKRVLKIQKNNLWGQLLLKKKTTEESKSKKDEYSKEKVETELKTILNKKMLKVQAQRE